MCLQQKSKARIIAFCMKAALH